MASKTIEEIGEGGLALTTEGHTVRITKIEPNPILQVVYGRSVIVHYERTDDPSLTGKLLAGTKTTVEVPDVAD